MKKTMILLFAMLATMLAGCEKEVENPSFDDNELYIYYESWFETETMLVGETYESPALAVSPNDGSVKCYWQINGATVAEGLTMTYVFNTAGIYTVKFIAERGSVTSSRTVVITVQ